MATNRLLWIFLLLSFLFSAERIAFGKLYGTWMNSYPSSVDRCKSWWRCSSTTRMAISAKQMMRISFDLPSLLRFAGETTHSTNGRIRIFEIHFFRGRLQRHHSSWKEFTYIFEGGRRHELADKTNRCLHELWEWWRDLAGSLNYLKKFGSRLPAAETSELEIATCPYFTTKKSVTNLNCARKEIFARNTYGFRDRRDHLTSSSISISCDLCLSWIWFFEFFVLPPTCFCRFTSTINIIIPPMKYR